MKKFLIFLLVIPNLLFADYHVNEKNVSAKDIINYYKSVDEINTYARGIVEGLIHAHKANYVLTGKRNICYTYDTSFAQSNNTYKNLIIIEEHYVKNKDLFKNTTYVYLANMALQEAYPCND